MSYETYAHVQDFVNVEERDSIKMKGINREIKIYSVSSIKKSINKSLIDRRTKEAGDQEISTEEAAFPSGLPSRILKIEKNLLTMSEKLERLINDKEDGK